jgi:putative transcriptional regulator
MPELHPAEETLLDHASGRLGRHLRPVVEAHLDLCSACRTTVAALAVPGGELLRRVDGPPPSTSCWSRLLARLDEPPSAPSLPPGAPVPPAAQAELTGGVQRSWGGFFTRGARFFVLDVDREGESILGMAQMPGGRRFPRHTHLGYEHSVVLAGGYRDESGTFEEGDFGVCPPGSDHGPDTLEGEPCWILFCLERPVRFHGWRGLLQRLAGH